MGVSYFHFFKKVNFLFLINNLSFLHVIVTYYSFTKHIDIKFHWDRILFKKNLVNQLQIKSSGNNCFHASDNFSSIHFLKWKHFRGQLVVITSDGTKMNWKIRIKFRVPVCIQRMHEAEDDKKRLGNFILGGVVSTFTSYCEVMVCYDRGDVPKDLLEELLLYFKLLNRFQLTEVQVERFID